jgi:dTDP-4-amino-4,6-dideoxygalactose transaminase
VRSPERDRIMDALKEAGVGTAAYYPVPLHRQEAFAGLGYAEGSLPVAEAACPETFALPAFPGITREQQEAVVGALREAGV